MPTNSTTILGDFRNVFEVIEERVEVIFCFTNETADNGAVFTAKICLESCGERDYVIT